MIIQRIWKDQNAPYFCLSTKSSTGKWRDHFFTKNEFHLIDQFLVDNRDKDIYFCPHGFTERERLEPYRVIPNVLWSDMDGADPRSVKFKPSVAIESSPGRFVGLWILRKKEKGVVHRFSKINRRLSHAIGGDPGGWDFTQVLRVPGTINYKYESMPKVRILWTDGPTWTLEELDKLLPSGNEEPAHQVDVGAIHKKWKAKLPWTVWKELTTRKTPEIGKRSDVMHKLGMVLIEKGATKEEWMTLIRSSVWNKFAGRSSEERQLEREYEKCVIKGKQAKKPVVGEDENEEEKKELCTTPLSEIEERDIEWLWYPYLARQQVTILQGDPEAGKTWIAQAIATAVCKGSRLPTYVKGIDPIQGRVISFDLENTPDVVMKKRARWIGLDEEAQKYFYQETEPLSIDNPDDLVRIFKALERVKPALVIFDTMMTYIGGADTNTGAQGQQAFSKFLHLAQRFNCSVLVVRHLTKSAREKAMYRGQGNIAITGLARIEITAGPHPEAEGDTERRMMAVSKINIARKPPALEYFVKDAGDPHNERDRDRAKFMWGTFDERYTADDLVNVKPAEKDPSERDEAKAFLKEVLSKGAAEAGRIERMAEARSISQSTLYRAKRELKIVSTTRGFGKDKTTQWSLPIDGRGGSEVKH
jgi:hypothetical protein